MKSKFEIGNFARRKSDGKIVEKVISNDGWVSYVEDRKITGNCPMEEVDDIDVKTAFLSRLQELLATFDAYIYTDKMDALNIGIGDDIHLKWIFRGKGINGAMLTSKRVFSHDKD